MLDLHARMDELAERHLGRTVDVDIEWGALGGYYGSLTVDDHDGFIVIDESLGCSRVPRYALDHVIWHEICHVVRWEQAEDLTHGPLFRVLEAVYPHHARALAWFKRLEARG